MAQNHKVFDYVVVLRQKNRRTVELIGLMAFAIFLVILIHRLVTDDAYRIITGLVTLAGLGLFSGNIIDFRAGKKPELLLSFLLAAIISLALLKLPWLSVPYFILALIYRRSVKPQEIGFSRDLIVFGGFFPRKIAWDQLNNVLIKDGLLTMDYKNNRIFQQETDELDEEDDDDVTEEEFNAFCRKCLR
jgi:hypothetical protein